MPIAFEAAVTAIQRVRSDSTASTAAAGSSRRSGSGSAMRTVAPARSAAISHGRTLASWSRRVQTISSPGPSVRPTAPENAIVSEVMLGPNATPSAGGVEHPGHRGPRALDDLLRRPRVRERPALVGGAPGAHPVRHRLDRGVDHLRAAGAVQARPAVGQPGEAVAVHASPFTSSRSCG